MKIDIKDQASLENQKTFLFNKDFNKNDNILLECLPELANNVILFAEELKSTKGLNYQLVNYEEDR